MRLLFLTSRLPYPPDRGDRLRAYHFLRHLAADHEITLVSFIQNVVERKFLASLEPLCTAVHTILMPPIRSVWATALHGWRGQPLQTAYYHHPAMRRLLADLRQKQQFDAAYIHLFRMAPYLADWSDMYRIVDLTDVISREITLSLPYRSWAWRAIYGVEHGRIRRYEQHVASHFEETWLISPADKIELLQRSPEANIQIIPNGVDTEKLKPILMDKRPNSLIFVGNMAVFHNRDTAVYLAQEILPGIRHVIPDCTLALAGAGTDAKIRALADLPGVEAVGYVPDLNQVLNETAVFISPLRFSAGVQNKVLEAMAAGTPVIASSNVNAGLQAQPGKAILLADDTKTIVQQAIRLLKEDQLQKKLAKNARQFVTKKFSWQHAVNRFQAIENQLTNG